MNLSDINIVKSRTSYLVYCNKKPIIIKTPKLLSQFGIETYKRSLILNLLLDITDNLNYNFYTFLRSIDDYFKNHEIGKNLTYKSFIKENNKEYITKNPNNVDMSLSFFEKTIMNNFYH